jgi:hypothetical protein
MSTVTAPIGLEIWLSGTTAELDVAARALAQLGRIAYRSDRHRLTGADAGRFRVYVRIYVPVAAAGRPQESGPTRTGGAVPLDLDTAPGNRAA